MNSEILFYFLFFLSLSTPAAAFLSSFFPFHSPSFSISTSAGRPHPPLMSNSPCRTLSIPPLKPYPTLFSTTTTASPLFPRSQNHGYWFSHGGWLGKEIHPEAEEGVGVVETAASAEEVGVEMVEVESLDLALKVEDLVVVLEVKRVMAMVVVILGAVMVEGGGSCCGGGYGQR